MLNVIIRYINGTSYSQNVRNEEVGRAYSDAVISVFKHDGFINHIESIEMINENAYKHLLYQKGQDDAELNIVRHDPLSGDVSTDHHPLLKSNQV
jgi:hypothetical protein